MSEAAVAEIELASTIGANLRRLRTHQNLTLEALARLSSVSKSMLGEIELGHSTPNISLLWRIANALGTQVAAFLQKNSALEVQLFRAGAGATDGSAVRVLGPATPHSRVRFHQLRVAAGGEEAGEACPVGAVINLALSEGILEIVAGAESYRLGAGDVAYFPAALPHVYRNPGPVTALAYRVTIYPVNLNFG